MSLIPRGETGARQTPVIMRANVLLYREFNHLGFLSTGSDFDADAHPWAQSGPGLPTQKRTWPKSASVTGQGAAATGGQKTHSSARGLSFPTDLEGGLDWSAGKQA